MKQSMGVFGKREYSIQKHNCVLQCWTCLKTQCIQHLQLFLKMHSHDDQELHSHSFLKMQPKMLLTCFQFQYVQRANLKSRQTAPLGYNNKDIAGGEKNQMKIAKCASNGQFTSSDVILCSFLPQGKWLQKQGMVFGDGRISQCTFVEFLYCQHIYSENHSLYFCTYSCQQPWVTMWEHPAPRLFC